MKFNFNFEDIKYVKISYKDNYDVNHSVKAGIKNITDREMILCSKFEDGLDIKTPQEISLSIVCKDGLYKTKTTLSSVENEEPYAFFILSTPQGFEYQQNREYFRVPIKTECIYSIRQNNEMIRIKANTIDLSANGVSINIPNLIISENEAYVSLNLGSRTIDARVKYIRSEKTNESYSISFSFVNLSESDRDLLSQVCIKKQLEQRRSSLF